MTEEREIRYDVFISYRWEPEEDVRWVRERLDPALRAAGLAVCLDVRDFTVGVDEFTEMGRAIEESRHGLCVVTPEYLAEGHMSGFERRLLRRFDPEARDSRLIPFVLRKADIPAWMRGPVPVDWTDERTHAAQWDRLLRDLKAPNRDAPPPGRLDEPPPPPPAPAKLEAAAVSRRRIDLSWSAAAGDGFKVERCRGKGCVDFSEVGQAAGHAYADVGLAAGTYYSYRVRASGPPAPPSAYSNTATAKTRPLLPPAAVAVALVAAVAAGYGLFIFLRPPPAKSLAGRICYVRDREHPHLVGAKNVFVFVPQRRDLTSEATDDAGNFVIKNIPHDVDVTRLGANDGGAELPPFAVDKDGACYEVVARPPGPSEDIRFIEEPWEEAPAAECRGPEGARYVKRFLLATRLARDGGRKDAEVTVTLNEAGDAKLSAYVLDPTEEMNDLLKLYENRAYTDAAHAFVFHIPERGMNVRLEACVGSNVSEAVLSPARLKTHYVMQ
ncbi:MAG TPA: toll/interleukin-1 receptor domain-containing protein [Pyrinomonadaceae bacterium]|jgi:hypothetical protein